LPADRRTIKDFKVRIRGFPFAQADFGTYFVVAIEQNSFNFPVVLVPRNDDNPPIPIADSILDFMAGLQAAKKTRGR
jgi:hypothetical protein